MIEDIHYLQTRRTYLLYKKAGWLSNRAEDAELDQINKKLNEPLNENKTAK